MYNESFIRENVPILNDFTSEIACEIFVRVRLQIANKKGMCASRSDTLSKLNACELLFRHGFAMIWGHPVNLTPRKPHIVTNKSKHHSLCAVSLEELVSKILNLVRRKFLPT